MKKIPFKEINDNDEFWCGAKFQKYGTTINNITPAEDYYEYMLFLDHSLKEWMICANIDTWERGAVACHIKLTKGLGRKTVTAKEFKKSMILPDEINNWYFIDDGIRETRIINK